METKIEKRDLKREWKELYAPSAREVSEAKVPRLRYLMIDGEGDPGRSPQFEAALGALYPLSYAAKFLSKRELGRDYVVMPLEGLWWAEDMEAFQAARRDEWKWTLMMLQPDWVSEDLMEAARAKATAKRGEDGLAAVRFESYEEGDCVQIMHLGPYTEEGPTVERLHRRIAEMGKAPRLRHHEIYLSDPRRTAPEKLRTALRQPLG